MIKINLLPPAFRTVKKKKSKPQAAAAGQRDAISALPWKWIGIVAGVFVVMLTLLLDVDYFRLNQKMKLINSEMTVVQPKMQSLKALEQEVTGTLVPEKDFLMTHVLNKAPITAILQEMSAALPDGMWLDGFSINNSGKDRSFKIQGLAINLENKTNIEQIEEYLQKLKKVISNAQFTYSTTKQTFEKLSATAFVAEYKWQAD